ncbi:nitroreductase family protein [Coraliomargarita algicola]|uniref:Nitroreductase family protein n=1 Tax=Coraliomargarita algicola TaxID=3092156 RepID=A0ABZ0RFR8_9BACT|nr:nitroreductase family protein [Coraliomargarita sp. J2-16]WPJ95009.1 nitroreductase family protein [Coraliomargarita sp. J2-16]
MNVFQKILIAPKLVACYAYDGWRFIRYAHLFDDPFCSQSCAQAHLYRLSHSLEKGLALPQPRVGFGRELTEQVMKDLEKYYAKFGADSCTADVRGILESLLESHEANGISWEDISSRLSALSYKGTEPNNSEQKTGLVERTRKEVLASLPASPELFFKQRHSVRQFSGVQIPRLEIERAVQLAQRAPSVCNRQGGRLHLYDEPTLKEKILAHQDGNRGFGDQAAVIVAVTHDLSIFYKNGERNQAFVDGGIFAMNLTMALHALGYGSCMLNWSMSPRQDVAMRKDIGIPEGEVIIALIAVGGLREKYTVAASPRRPVESIASWNK